MPVIQGEHTYIGLPVNEYFHPEVEIGKFCSIAEEVIWCGAMNHPQVKHRKAVTTFNLGERWGLPFFEVSVSRGKIIVGNDVWIGRGVTVLDGVTIGDGATIGMRAVVAKDVPPYAVVVGNPGVIKHYRFTKPQIKKLLEIKWWEWPNELIKERVADFKDVEIFVKKYG